MATNENLRMFSKRNVLARCLIWIYSSNQRSGGWRPSLVGWRPSPLRRPLQLGWCLLVRSQEVDGETVCRPSSGFLCSPGSNHLHPLFLADFAQPKLGPSYSLEKDGPGSFHLESCEGISSPPLKSHRPLKKESRYFRSLFQELRDSPSLIILTCVSL